MATLTLPTPLVSEFGRVYRIDLDGVFYRFAFIWNPRANTWTLGVGSNDGTELVRGLRLNLGDDILAPHKSRAVPQGNLRVVDTSLQGVEPERTDLGARVLLEYVEPAAESTA